MHKLRSIEISGFRGQKKPVLLNFAEDANFIIGRNGTGKTTLINLINAALAADLQVLRESKFDKIEMKFRAKRSNKIPRVKIERSDYPDQSIELTYSIHMSTSSPPEVFTISMNRRRPPPPSSRPRNVPPLITHRELSDRLSKIYQTKWLSLQRGMDKFEREQTEFPELELVTDVDRKLDQVLTELVKYFSRLDSLVAEQTQLFQKRWFLSFLATERSPNAIGINKINLAEERAAITAIFEKFGVPLSSYELQLDRHLKLAEKVADAINAKKGVQFKDFLVLYDVMRLHSLVEQWGELQNTQKKIYSPKSEFVSIASEMLFRKNVSISRSNQVVVLSDDKIASPIPNRQLSSGEKQLMIFLSETLLQEQSPYIFLADEPELSLHVEWQEELVPNLLRINPNAQVIFATHSPDIVNIYQENLIKMEQLVD